MHTHKPNHSTRHLSLTVSAHVGFKSRKTYRCSSSWFLFHGQWRNQTLRPFWPVCENNSFLRCATSASISIDGIRLEGDSGCVALILSGSIHARSSAILFYPAWACVDKCPVFFFSDTFEWSTFIFLFCISKLFDFNSFLDPCLYLCILLSLSCLFLTFYLDFFLLSVSHLWFPWKSLLPFLPLSVSCFLVLSRAADWYAEHSALQTLRVCRWLRERRPAIWLTGWAVINDASTAWWIKRCK